MCLSVLYRNPNGWTDQMKFGTEVVLEGGAGFDPIPPPLRYGCLKGVRGASGASAVGFGKNFIKQKLQGAPDLVEGGSPFLAPNPDPEGLGPHILL